MATVKRVSGDFNIRSVTPATDNVNVTTGTFNVDGNVRVTGNLNVLGGFTEIAVTQTTITDPFITLGAGNTGTERVIGIEVVKNQNETVVSGLQKAGIRWNTDENRWELSNDLLVWYPVASALDMALVNDPAPTLAASLNTAGNAIYSPNNLSLVAQNGAIYLQPAFKLPHLSAELPAESGYTTVYAQPMSAGGTALYMSSFDQAGTEVREELISKTRAIIYSIIF